MKEAVLAYLFGLGSGNVRADWDVVLCDGFSFELCPVHQLPQPQIRGPDMLRIGILSGTCGHRLEVKDALLVALGGNGEAKDG